MAVKTLKDFVPVSRADGIPWVQAIIQQAVTPTEDAAETIDTIVLDPVDTDPENPLARTFTTSNATDLPGYFYRVVFVDANGDGTQPTDWLRDAPETPHQYRPALGKVGSLVRTRLKDSNGAETGGRFTAVTRPTTTQAVELIDTAVNELSLSVGDVIPVDLTTEASELAALRAAMLIELTYFPEQVATGRSPYAEWKNMYEGDDGKSGRLNRLVLAVNAANQEGSVTASGSGSPKFSFRQERGWMNRVM